MKKVTLAVCVLLAAVILGVGAYAVFGGGSEMFSAGKARREALEQRDKNPDIVAEFHGHEIDRSAVEYSRQMTAMLTEEEAKKYNTDRDIIERIVENIALVEEAEKRGLAATEEEIEEMVNATKTAYEMPEGKEMLDEYCQGMGITIEEYYEIIREQAPRTIARQKLKDAVRREYCEEHGIEFTKINPPAELKEAEEKFINDLLKAARKDIKFYI